MSPTEEVMTEGLPRLSPIWNSSELRGLCRRSYFGPRACGRGITIFIEVCGALNQGFPFSPLQCRQGRARMGAGGCPRGNVYDASSDCVGVSALSSLEAFCKGLERSTQLFIAWRSLNDEVRAILRTRTCTRIPAHAHAHSHGHLQLARVYRAF